MAADSRCMTTTAGDPILELGYPKAFAAAIAPALTRNGNRFTHVHLTGATVERDHAKALWVKSDARRVKENYRCSILQKTRQPIIYGALSLLVLAWSSSGVHFLGKLSRCWEGHLVHLSGQKSLLLLRLMQSCTEATMFCYLECCSSEDGGL